MSSSRVRFVAAVSFVICFIYVFIDVHAESGTCGEHLTFENDGGILTIKGSGPMYDYDTNTNEPPWDVYSIEHIVIDEGVTSIGSYAFNNVNLLKTVSIPDTVKTIGTYAFLYCYDLSNLVIPDSVTTISNGAFCACTQLENLSLPSTLKSIGKKAFSSCNHLKEVVIPASVESIGENAFSSIYFLSKVIILGGIETVEADVFGGDENLKSVYYLGTSPVSSNLLSDLGSLDDVCVRPDYDSDSFSGKPITPNTPNCTAFASMYNHCYEAAYLDGGLTAQKRTNATEWENQSSGCEVYQCDNNTGPLHRNKCCGADLTYVISGGVLVIRGTGPMDDYSMNRHPPWYDERLYVESIVIEDGATSIGAYAFEGFSVMKSVTISKSVKTIGENSFLHCYNLTGVTIPDGVTKVDNGAFYGSSNLTKVTLPSTLKSIGSLAFAACYNLKEIVIPASVESIDDYAFQNCKSLTSIIMFDEVQSVGMDVFSFCSSLESVFYLRSTPVTSNTFSSVDTLRNICVPPDYSSDSFCGKSITNDTATCQAYQRLFNQCFEADYVNNGWISKKRENVLNWENKITECVECQCLNDTGVTCTYLCVSKSDGKNRMCLDERCVHDNSLKGVSVVIELVDGVELIEVNTSEIIETIRQELKITVDELKVGYEVNDDGFVFRLILYVNDEETANKIVSGINKLGYNCKSVLCRRKSVRVFIQGSELLSIGSHLLFNTFVMFSLLLIFMIIGY